MNSSTSSQKENNIKVLLVFNSDLHEVFAEWKRDGSCAHHLWGITELHKYDMDFQILPYKKYTFLKWISNRLKLLGDLDIQLRILLIKNQYDVIYNAHQMTTSLLTLLRYVGIFNKPIVTIVHRSFKKSLFSQIFITLFLKGNDKLLCLSEKTQSHLRNNFKIPDKKLDFIEWYIDTKYEQYQDDNIYFGPPLNSYILSSGSTYRDYETLIESFRGIDYQLKILAGGKYAYSKSSSLPNNVYIFDKSLETQYALEEVKKSYAVAIPLNIGSEPCNPFGITSLLEAMAMGKAVVITHHEYIGIDVEKEGIGLIVAPGDIEGWRKSIVYLLENPDIAKEMGYRGRKLIKEKFTLDNFSRKLAIHLKNTI